MKVKKLTNRSASCVTAAAIIVASVGLITPHMQQFNANAADEDLLLASAPADVNGDSVVNVFDLALYKQYITSGLELPISNSQYIADVDENGTVDLNDVKMVQDFIVGKIPYFNFKVMQYLAINGEITNGITESVNAGSSTGTYVNLDNEIGSNLKFTINVPEDGNYRLTFQNANGGKADRPMRISISGSEDTWRVPFPITENWTTWSQSSVIIPLNAGTQTITLTSITADGGPNLDYMNVEKVDLDADAPEKKVKPKNGMQVEELDRGLVAANTGKGMLISWRSLATDETNTSFKLYKNGELLAEISSDAATNYLDGSGTAEDKYTIETYEGTSKVHNAEYATVFGTKNSGQSGAYFDIPLDVPEQLTMPDGTTCTYLPNDASVGDADGDGEYEIFLKWDPSNSQDNSKNGYTGNVYIDCYKLDGTKLWRIDLGKNIRAGAHYTQFMVYDYDGDGISELVCKTADGTIDGTGKVIGDASADYRSEAGRILTGSEYLTLFDGKTGKALDTIDYKPGRGDFNDWGDNYGNRVDRFTAATVYLNGKTPSVVMCRGYYTRMAATAYDVVDKKLVERWVFDTGHDEFAAGYGDGNHNCMPADVDSDGKQELVMGSMVIDDNGKLLYTSGLGHGDALHIGDLDPSNPGLEIFMCHEEKESGCGISLRDGKTGNMLFRETAGDDTGRCLADNLISGNNTAELIGSHNSIIYDTSGNNIGNWSEITKWGQNSVVYWTDTLERAVMDRAMIDQYGKGRVFTGDGASYNNGSKSNAVISCDLLGDWREEVIFHTNNGSALRVFTTTYSTDYKIYSLMHNPQYRAQVAGQNVGYNQPPHTDYFLGTGFALPEVPEVYAAQTE